MDVPGHELFEWSEPLIRVCTDFDVEIVLRTSWTARLPLNQVLSLLPAELSSRVVGMTWPIATGRLDRTQNVSRYEVIREHVEWNALVNWVALDDNDDGWPHEERHHLVLCDPEFGLSRLLTELELRERLLCFSGGGRT